MVVGSYAQVVFPVQSVFAGSVRLYQLVTGAYGGTQTYHCCILSEGEELTVICLGRSEGAFRPARLFKLEA